MKYIKQQILEERTINDRRIVIKGDGSIEVTPTNDNTTFQINGNLIVTGRSPGPTNDLTYHVSLEGDDANDGLAAGGDRAKRTIKSAVEAAPEGATIQIAPGDYYEENPITLKRKQTVRGDSLRNTQIWPNNPRSDMFFLDNACYIFQITFRGLRDPAWCVRIKPGALVTVSPYVQNCTNMNGPWLNDGTEFIPFVTEQIEGVEAGARPIIDDPSVPLEKRVNETGGGNGMLVDGNEYHPDSLIFSMVCDAFTQIAQGGIGFHITNFGYTQIVSCFTVFTRIGYLTTKGGYLSISNSVSDFGTFGVIADGAFDDIYTTAVPSQDYYSTVGSVTVNSTGSGYTSVPVVVIDPPTSPGGVQAIATARIDETTGQVTAISVDNPGEGYDFIPNITFVGGGFSVPATATANLATNTLIEVTSLRDLPQVGSIISFENDPTAYYVTNTTVTQQPFFYDEEVCRRDVGLLIDGIIGDAVLGTNYQAIAAGRAYLRGRATKVIAQQLEPTVFAMETLRDEILNRVPDSDPANETIRYSIIEGFATVINILEQGDSTVVPDVLYNDLGTVDAGIIAAKNNIVDNRDFIAEEITRYIAEQFTDLSYNQETCERDIRLLTVAVAFDVGAGTNYNSVTVGRAYLRANANIVQTKQKDVTVASFEQLKSLILALPLVDSSVTSEQRVTDAIDEVIEIILQGDSTSADDLVFPAPIGGTTAPVNAKDQLRANREFIQEEIIAWIGDNYGSLSYDVSRCSRDVGYIVDALSYDILYGGNSASRSAADAYFVGTASQLGASETAATSAAYARLQDILVDIIQGRLITKTFGNPLTQNTSNDSGSVNESNSSNSLIQIIIDTIEAGNTSSLPTIVYPDLSWALQDDQNSFSEIFGQRNILPAAITTYILENFPTFTYDRTKCKRDVELIVDAVVRDALLNTNHNIITAGKAYRRATASIVDADQFPATIRALRHLKSEMEALVSTSPTVLSRVTDRMETLLEVVEYGTIPSEGVTFPSPSSAAQTTIDAARQLQDNRTFLVEETIAYTNDTYPGLVYDEEKCRRDAELIIDGITHDLLYGGNRSTLISARAYFDDGASIIAGQEAETIDSIERLKTVSTSVIEGALVTRTTGNTEVQSQVGPYGIASDSAVSESLYDIVINAITGGLLTTPQDADPDYSWVAIGVTNAVELLTDGSVDLQLSVIDYITDSIIGFTYDVDTCARDVTYIVDAATYDMMYGGNKQTRRASEAYYNNAVIPGETEETEFAYKHLAKILSDIAQNVTVSPSEGNVVTQEVAGTAGSLTAAQTIFNLVEKISQVVREGSASLPFEIDHSYDTHGSVADLADRETILNDAQAIEDTTIETLNLQYGGLAELSLFPGVISVTQGTLGNMQNVSTVSTSGHAFEYVGAGITYNALPFFGGSPIAENEFIETDNGKVFAGGVVDQIGNFKVGNFFTVNALTGAITLNANEINLSGLSSIGPFQRNGIPVGTVLREVSNSSDLIASTGTQEIDTAPTQQAVATYVENRYLNKQTGGTVEGDIIVNGDVAVNGGDLTTTQTTFNLIDDNASTVNFARGATAVVIGANLTGLTTIRHDVDILGTLDVGGDTVIVGNLNATVGLEEPQAFSITAGTEDFISLNTQDTFEKVTFGSIPLIEIQNMTDSFTSTNGALVVGGGIGLGGNLNVGGDLSVAGSNITTTATTVNLFDDVTANVNAFGDATEITIGRSGVTPGNFIVNNDNIIFNSVYSLKLPTGTTGERGDTDTQGYVRFNTDLGQFEGYDGLAWSSLGGVRDVDGNTFIIPETSPGSNENVLSFFTDGFERMSLSTSALTLDSTITSIRFNGTTESLSPDSGALVVEGGVGIEKQLNVRGDVRFYNDALIEGGLVATGTVEFGTNDSTIDQFTVNASSQFNVLDNTVSAFDVSEGANSYFRVTTSDTLEEVTFGTTPVVRIDNTTASTNSTTGALVVAGGLGVANAAHIGTDISVGGNATIGSNPLTNTLTVNALASFLIRDNVASAFSVRESTNEYFTIDTTNGLEKLELGSIAQVAVLNATDSTDTNTGALTVEGGVGIDLNLNVGVDASVGRNLVVTGDVAVNGGDLTSTATTFNLLNANATTVNAFGAATTIAIGAATGTLTINNDLVIIDSNEALQIPTGTTGERPAGIDGRIRLNTSTSQFEGYAAGAWNSLGGVRDVDGDTTITAESTPGADEDVLTFLTGAQTSLTLSSTAFDLNAAIDVAINATTNSVSTATGALVVDGGVGIAENLYVGGRIGGDIQIGSSSLDILDLRSGTILSPSTVKLVTDVAAQADQIVYPLTLAHHNLSGTPAAGGGTGIRFEFETAFENFENIGQIDFVAQDVTGLQEDFDIVFSSMIAGSLVEQFRISENVSTLTTDLAINNDTLSTNQTTFNLLDTTATTINFGGAATVISIGAAGGLTTFDQSVTVNETLTANALALTTDLAVEHGGTGVSTLTENGIVYGDTANPVQATAAAGTSDASESFQILTVTSAVDATPVWTDTIDGGTF